jgi:hypothetical protein
MKDWNAHGHEPVMTHNICWGASWHRPIEQKSAQAAQRVSDRAQELGIQPETMAEVTQTEMKVWNARDHKSIMPHDICWKAGVCASREVCLTEL